MVRFCVIADCNNKLGNRNYSGYCKNHSNMISKQCIECNCVETKQQWYSGPTCRDCFKKKYYRENINKVKAKVNEYYLSNRNSIVIKNKHYRNNNKEKITNLTRQWIIKNRDLVRIKSNLRYKEKECNDLNFKISNRLRHRVRAAILRFNDGIKVSSAIKDLGCSIEELKFYLESKFQEGMSWDNYGSWHIDHIKPLSGFNLSDPEDFSKACHYTNLQPLWAKDNIRKGKKQWPVNT